MGKEEDTSLPDVLLLLKQSDIGDELQIFPKSLIEIQVGHFAGNSLHILIRKPCDLLIGKTKLFQVFSANAGNGEFFLPVDRLHRAFSSLPQKDSLCYEGNGP